MLTKYELYLIVRGDVVYKKKFGCLGDAVEWVKRFADWRDARIYDSQGICLFSPNPEEMRR